VALTVDGDVSLRVPLVGDRQGAVRVGGTRVGLEVVVDAFRQGSTAEEIAAAYTALALDDVYAVIAYYLRHQADVDAYVADRRAAAGALRARTERELPQPGLRERLQARRDRVPGQRSRRAAAGSASGAGSGSAPGASS
jgi:uncharacterized protein (DUF433 family)